ncbi:hypothetical protein L9H26_18835 [Morganella psychrotolerans]|uniref:Uncharacterized protein n=1 Tax=Morganella psychrotolerans TaxID=368603 RepID=A0A5M9QZT0_9GAMM|nr:hypothetical protein [Morganella psychrotolerans]KAA8713066.1 hypothetical protein F4V73_18300 [Morganella psychrotolerans]OBU01938.1 hypothetical protein AYY16_17170 [Morganella psychrotolerans]
MKNAKTNPDFESALRCLPFMAEPECSDRLTFWSPESDNSRRLGMHYGACFIDLLKAYPHVSGSGILHRVMTDIGDQFSTLTVRGFVDIIEHVIVNQCVTRGSVKEMLGKIERENETSRRIVVELSLLDELAEAEKSDNSRVYSRLDAIRELSTTPVKLKNILSALKWVKDSDGMPSKHALNDGFVRLDVRTDSVKTVITEKGMAVLKGITIR